MGSTPSGWGQHFKGFLVMRRQLETGICQWVLHVQMWNKDNARCQLLGSNGNKMSSKKQGEIQAGTGSYKLSNKKVFNTRKCR